MKKNGFSTIELLVSFIIISFVSIAMFNTVLDLLDRIQYYQEQSKITIIVGNVTNAMQSDFNRRKIYKINTCGTNCYEFIYQDFKANRLIINRDGATIQYGGIAQKIPKGYTISSDIAFERIINSNVTADKSNALLKILIPIKSTATDKIINIRITYIYDERDIGSLPVSYGTAPRN